MRIRRTLPIALAVVAVAAAVTFTVQLRKHAPPEPARLLPSGDAFFYANFGWVRKANGGKPDLTAIRDDLDALKTDLGALLKYAKNGAVDGVSDEAKRLYGKLSAQSGELYGKLSAQSGETLETVTRQIEENPLASLLIAFGVGFIFARILSR